MAYFLILRPTLSGNNLLLGGFGSLVSSSSQLDFHLPCCYIQWWHTQGARVNPRDYFDLPYGSWLTIGYIRGEALISSVVTGHSFLVRLHRAQSVTATNVPTSATRYQTVWLHVETRRIYLIGAPSLRIDAVQSCRSNSNLLVFHSLVTVGMNAKCNSRAVGFAEITSLGSCWTTPSI